jgi:hypothetical protein
VVSRHAVDMDPLSLLCRSAASVSPPGLHVTGALPAETAGQSVSRCRLLPYFDGSYGVVSANEDTLTDPPSACVA